MKESTMKTLLCCTILVVQSHCGWGKPGGDYASLGDYGTAEIGGAYGTLPDTSALLSKTDLKPASTYDIGFGGPIAEPIVPAVFPVGGLGWGWKQQFPQPFFAPIQIIAKPVPVPVTIPFGWGWPSPGIF